MYPCFFLSDKVQGTVLPNGSATRTAGLNFGDQPLAFAVHGEDVVSFCWRNATKKYKKNMFLISPWNDFLQI